MTSDLSPLARAVALAESTIGLRYHWSLSAGCVVGNGPHYAFSIWPAERAGDGSELEPLTLRENDDPLGAVMDCLRDVGLAPERAN